MLALLLPPSSGRVVGDVGDVWSPFLSCHVYLGVAENRTPNSDDLSSCLVLKRPFRSIWIHLACISYPRVGFEVNFVYEEQEMTVAIPQGYNVGQQAPDQMMALRLCCGSNMVK